MPGDNISYDEEAGQYRTDVAFESTDSVADAVVISVASILECDPTALPPLSDVVDTDALNRVFPANDADAKVEVAFEYSGFDVTVADGGQITLEEQDTDGS